jgi:hypothetical protein
MFWQQSCTRESIMRIAVISRARAVWSSSNAGGRDSFLSPTVRFQRPRSVIHEPRHMKAVGESRNFGASAETAVAGRVRVVRAHGGRGEGADVNLLNSWMRNAGLRIVAWWFVVSVDGHRASTPAAPTGVGSSLPSRRASAARRRRHGQKSATCRRSRGNGMYVDVGASPDSLDVCTP